MLCQPCNGHRIALVLGRQACSILLEFKLILDEISSSDFKAKSIQCQHVVCSHHLVNKDGNVIPKPSCSARGREFLLAPLIKIDKVDPASIFIHMQVISDARR